MDVGLVLGKVSVEVLELRGEMLFEVLLAQDYAVFGQDLDLEFVKAGRHFLSGKAVLLLELNQANHKEKQSQRVVLHSQQALYDLSVFLLVDHYLIAYVFVYF